MAAPDRNSCISVEEFSVERYRGDLGAPGVEEMAELAEPYSTLIEVVASGCG